MNERATPATRAADLVILQAKAALADDLAAELRLYRGFVTQFNEDHAYSRLFAPLAAYDALFGKDQEHE